MLLSQSYYLLCFMQGLVTALRLRLGQRLEQSQTERYSLRQESQSIKCFPIARVSETLLMRLLQYAAKLALTISQVTVVSASKVTG